MQVDPDGENEGRRNRVRLGQKCEHCATRYVDHRDSVTGGGESRRGDVLQLITVTSRKSDLILFQFYVLSFSPFFVYNSSDSFLGLCSWSAAVSRF